jgi:hypothetical protein
MRYMESVSSISIQGKPATTSCVGWQKQLVTAECQQAHCESIVLGDKQRDFVHYSN